MAYPRHVPIPVAYLARMGAVSTLLAGTDVCVVVQCCTLLSAPHWDGAVGFTGAYAPALTYSLQMLLSMSLYITSTPCWNEIASDSPRKVSGFRFASTAETAVSVFTFARARVALPIRMQVCLSTVSPPFCIGLPPILHLLQAAVKWLANLLACGFEPVGWQFVGII